MRRRNTRKSGARRRETSEKRRKQQWRLALPAKPNWVLALLLDIDSSGSLLLLPNVFGYSRLIPFYPRDARLKLKHNSLYIVLADLACTMFPGFIAAFARSDSLPGLLALPPVANAKFPPCQSHVSLADYIRLAATNFELGSRMILGVLIMERQELNAITTSQDNSEQSWQQAALIECWPGGPVVTRREDCGQRDGWRNSSGDADSALPDLELLDTRQS